MFSDIYRETPVSQKRPEPVNCKSYDINPECRAEYCGQLSKAAVGSKIKWNSDLRFPRCWENMRLIESGHNKFKTLSNFKY